MTVPGLGGARALLVELAVRCAQPAERDIAVVMLGVEGEVHQLPVGVELLDCDEEVHVVGADRLDPQPQLDVTDDVTGSSKVWSNCARPSAGS